MSSSENRLAFPAPKKPVVTFRTERSSHPADGDLGDLPPRSKVPCSPPGRGGAASPSTHVPRQSQEFMQSLHDKTPTQPSQPTDIASTEDQPRYAVQCRPPLLFDGLLTDPAEFEEHAERDPPFTPTVESITQAVVNGSGDGSDAHSEPIDQVPSRSLRTDSQAIAEEPPPLEDSPQDSQRDDLKSSKNLGSSVFCAVVPNPLIGPSGESTASNEIALLERLSNFLERLSVENKNRSGLIEVHRLKRVAHAAKLTCVQRAKLIPPHAQSKKLIPVSVCTKSFANHAQHDPQDADALLAALEALTDAVVASQESVLSRIEERLAKVVSDNRAKFADNLFRNVWDTVHLLSIIAFYVVALEQNVLYLNTDYVSTTPHDGSPWVLVLFVCITVFWALDVVYSTQVLAIDRDGRLIKDRWAIVEQRRPQLIVDCIALIPIDFILEASSAPFAAFLTFRVLKFVKILRISYLYELVNRDIVTPALVVFHFQVKKVLIGISWLILLILTFGAVHNLIDKYSIEPAYGERKYPLLSDSVVAVCVILSGSNAEFEVWVAGDKVLYIGLAVLSMIGIGLIVGQLTSLVFTNSISAENYQLMRDTLGIVEHYNVPRAIQREVLSFQMHALNDDVVRHMSNLAQLPLQMQQEIMMYIKIDAVAKVKLFGGAPRECQTVLASSLSRCIVEPEVEIVRHGEIGSEMYMMAHGYADVILGNGKVVTTFTRGDCFGEMALVQQDARRTATVRALTYCDLWTLAKGAFLEALAVYPEFAKTIEAEVLHRSGNVEELRASVFAVHQELLRSENEDLGPRNDDQPLVALEVVGSSQSDPLATNPADLDVHLERGLTSHWSTKRRATFRRMSVDPRNASASGIPTLFREASSGRWNASAKPETAKDDSIDSQVQDALRAIEAAKERMRQDRAALPSVPPAGLRRRSLFGVTQF